MDSDITESRPQASGADEATAPPSALPPAEPETSPAAPHHKRSFLRELPVLVVIAFVVALLIKTFVLQAFYIPSGSMEPTLMIGDRVLVEKVSYRFTSPHRGNVVVFEKDLFGGTTGQSTSFWGGIENSIKGLFGFPTGNSEDLIKRVIGVAGDTVEGKDGKVYVNGSPIAEPYLPSGVQTSSFPATKVPEGKIFVMGDNRGNSDDSRNFGPVPVDTVVGHAFLVIWPPGDFSTL